jgi:hypothetical protein
MTSADHPPIRWCWAITTPIRRGGDVVGGAGITNLGIFYTGHKRFVVGLDLQFTSANQAQGTKKIDVATGRIVLRYDFK